MPVSASYRPDPLFARLGPEFADPVEPARFPAHTLRWRNQAWAARVGLDALTPAEWEAAFARFEPLPGNQGQPLAMRYHGHQFRNYNPDIGDGRGFLYAQLRDDAGRLLDFGTKGSGQTPYSRFGDGKLTLKGGVREVLAATMLEALGVYTSKPFSLYETGEALQRHDEPSPTRGAVLVRLQHSHIRFGTFQRLAYFDETANMRALIDHVVEAYYPHLRALEGEARAVAMYAEVVRETARLAASWMTAGFVHGVLNTDNFNITGESFDYGPWRFLPASEPGFTAAYFDQNGLYAFGRQPEAAMWNLAQLASAMTVVAPVSALEPELQRFGPLYGAALRESMCARLGIAPGAELSADLEFLQALLNWMTESKIGWAQFFHDWTGGAASAARAAASPVASFYEAPLFAPVRGALESRTPTRTDFSHPYFQRPHPCGMLIDELEAIWAPIAERDDWSVFEAKLAAIAEMNEALGLSCHRSVTAAD